MDDTADNRPFLTRWEALNRELAESGASEANWGEAQYWLRMRGYSVETAAALIQTDRAEGVTVGFRTPETGGVA